MLIAGQDKKIANTNYTTDNGIIREAAGLFSSNDDLQDAIRELEGAVFPRQDISVMGSHEALEGVFGTQHVDSSNAMDDPATPRMAPSRPEEQTIGSAALVGIPAYIGAMTMALAAGAVSIPAAIGAAVIGGIGGGTIGGVLSKILHDRYRHKIEEQIEEGGILLWVRTPDAEREEIAQNIMIKCGGHNVHIHETI